MTIRTKRVFYTLGLFVGTPCVMGLGFALHLPGWMTVIGAFACVMGCGFQLAKTDSLVARPVAEREPPSDPIFVFTDDLSVHRTLRDAALYHEFRETLLAYNRHGVAFEIPPSWGGRPIRLAENRKVELIRKLRMHLARYALSRPEHLEMTKWEVKHAPEDEIIRLAVELELVPESPPREHWWQFWRAR